MDFITHLPPSIDKTTILVIIDWLSKHAYFSALGPNSTAPQVTEIFIWDVVPLHGVPTNIVSDRDPLFMSYFWREPFHLQGVVLVMSSAYHRQSDGRTTVINQYLEDYLRCFIANTSKHWVCLLLWAEWHYNITYHLAIQMTL